MKRRVFSAYCAQSLTMAASGLSLVAHTKANAQQDKVSGQVGFTWLGHGTFLYKSPRDKRLLIDPWITANPAMPSKYRRVVGEGFERIDLLLYSHGHGDHFELPDARALIERFEPALIAPWELNLVIKSEIPAANAQLFTLANKGSWTTFDGIKVAMVPATHSSGAHFSGFEGKTRYVGGEVGYLMEFENGLRVYHSGDTGLMADMKFVIGDFYKPDVAVLCIGGVYTMGPEEAAYACKLIRPRYVIPIHYKTFPVLEPNADRFVEYLTQYAPDTKAIVLEPGESITI